MKYLAQRLALSKAVERTEVPSIKNSALTFIFIKSPNSTGMLFIITSKRDTLLFSDASPPTMFENVITKSVRVKFPSPYSNEHYEVL